MDVKTLTATDAAYIAGIVDGEGTVTLIRKHANENRQLSVSVSNNDKRLLHYLLQTIGAGKITGKRVAAEHHAPNFTYAIYNRQALSVLQQIQPYVKTYKAERAGMILRDYVRLTPRNGKYSDDLRTARKEFEQAVLGISR